MFLFRAEVVNKTIKKTQNYLHMLCIYFFSLCKEVQDLIDVNGWQFHSESSTWGKGVLDLPCRWLETVHSLAEPWSKELYFPTKTSIYPQIELLGTFFLVYFPGLLKSTTCLPAAWGMPRRWRRRRRWYGWWRRRSGPSAVQCLGCCYPDPGMDTNFIVDRSNYVPSYK